MRHIAFNGGIYHHSTRENPVEVWVSGFINAAAALVDTPWLDAVFKALL